MEMDELPPEEESADERRTRPFQVVAVTIALVLVMVVGGMLYWQQWRSEKDEGVRMAGLGAAYLEKGDKVSARACLSRAVALDPKNAEAKRLLDSLGDEGMEPVVERGANGEVLEGEETVAAPGPPAQVIPEQPTVMPEKIAESPRLDPALVEKHLKRAEELAGEKNWEGAEAALREAVAVDLGVKSKQALAMFLMGRPMSSEKMPELLELLRAVGQSQTVDGAAALATALTKGMVPAGEVAAWLTLIRAHPQATLPMLLAVDRVDVQLRPREKTVVAAEAVKRVEGAAVGDRVAVLQWLTEIGDEGRGKGVLTLDEAIKDSVMLDVWIVARVRAGEWGEVLEALNRPGNPWPAHLVKMLRGRALTSTGSEEEGRAMCSEAIREAEGDQKRMIEILAMLAMLGEQELFEVELEKALKDPDGAEAILHWATVAASRTRDARLMRRLYEIAAKSPVLKGSVVVQSILSHYRLLLGMDEDIVELANRAERAVDNPVPRLTLALAMLNLGDRVRALSELEEKKPEIDVTSLGVSQQAVVAAVLAANFRRDEALGMVARMPMRLLTQVEVDWLRGYLDGDVAPKYQMKVKENEGAAWKKTAWRIGIDAAVVVGVLLAWRVYMRIRYGRMAKDSEP
jgi:tetratricopeptide (TPR) repeat protein